MQGKEEVLYGYDGDGNKVAREWGKGHKTELSNFVNDVATALPVILSEQDSDAQVNYVYGLGLISQSEERFHETERHDERKDKSFEFFYHFDGLGSVMNLTDNKGKEKQKYRYDAWGNPGNGEDDDEGEDDESEAKRSDPPDRFRFTGEELDGATGLYYLRARWYDPGVGRFINKDPSGGTKASPLSQNQYIYVKNNPVNAFDPLGLFSAERNTAQSNSGLVQNQLAAVGVNPGVKVGLGYFRTFLLKALEVAGQIPKGAGTFISGLFAVRTILKEAEVIPPKVAEIDEIYRNRPDLRDQMNVLLPDGKSWDQLSLAEKESALNDVCIALGGGFCSGFLFPRVPQGL